MRITFHIWQFTAAIWIRKTHKKTATLPSKRF